MMGLKKKNPQYIVFSKTFIDFSQKQKRYPIKDPIKRSAPYKDSEKRTQKNRSTSSIEEFRQRIAFSINPSPNMKRETEHY
jgi:hypothetical protein